jgi:hypothetical protein
MVGREPLLMWAIESGLHADLAREIPQEACEFSDSRGADLVRWQVTCVQTTVSLAQTQLRLRGNLAQHPGLAFATHFHLAGDPCREAIRPGRLDQNATGVSVAGFGDRASARDSSVERSLGTSPRNAMSWLGVGKASEVTKFGNQRDGGNEICHAISSAPRRAILSEGDVLPTMGQTAPGRASACELTSGTLAGLALSM